MIRIKILFKSLLDLSLKEILIYFVKLFKRNSVKTNSEYPAKILNDNYFLKQEKVLMRNFKLIDDGYQIDEVLKNPNFTEFLERIVEYSFFYKWIKSENNKVSILDVGCVLNNNIVKKILETHCNEVWFCNPALEKVIDIKIPKYYHIENLTSSFPNEQVFPLVTCLSTIEHMGFDNSQYGDKSVAKYTEPNLLPFQESFKKLSELTAPGGRLLISFPFGFKEVLIHPVTNKKSSQVIDYNDLRSLVPILENNSVTVEVNVFEASKEGWVIVDPKECNARYGKGVPGAKAVAMLNCTKY